MASILLKIAQITLVRRPALLLRLSQFRSKPLPLLANIKSPSKIVLLSPAVAMLKYKTNKEDDKLQSFDLNLQQACELGDSAIIEVMDILKDEIISICKAYQECLKKQMEIINEASNAGALSSRWDDLPQYRSLASELSEELNNFTAVLNTVGQMASEESMKYITENKEQVRLISRKIHEVKGDIKIQIDQIRKTEAALLELNKRTILKTK